MFQIRLCTTSQSCMWMMIRDLKSKDEVALPFLIPNLHHPLETTFIKIRRVGVKLFPADGQTDTMKLIFALHNFANAPEKLVPLRTFPELSKNYLPEGQTQRQSWTSRNSVYVCSTNYTRVYKGVQTKSKPLKKLPPLWLQLHLCYVRAVFCRRLKSRNRKFVAY
jgi:hypothetical protein